MATEKNERGKLITFQIVSVKKSPLLPLAEGRNIMSEQKRNREQTRQTDKQKEIDKGRWRLVGKKDRQSFL